MQRRAVADPQMVHAGVDSMILTDLAATGLAVRGQMSASQTL